MSTEVQTASAGADQKPVGKNISSSELIAARIKTISGVKEAKNPPPEQKEGSKVEAQPEPEAVKEDVKPEEPSQQPEATQTEEESKVLSKDVDLENMSELELRELAQKLGSKAVARFGELTAKRKAAEEQLEALKAELARREEDAPLKPKVENNPYSNLATADELQSKVTEVNEVIEWAEDILDRSEHLAHDDVAANVNGKEYTKLEIKEAMKKARRARDTYLPAQSREIKLANERVAFKQSLIDRSKQELPWLQGEDNDVRKQYEAMLKDERLKGVEKALPDLASQLPYILAHAANSMYNRKAVEAKPTPRLSPPSPVISQTTQSNTPQSRQAKALDDLSQRLGKSGSYSDFKKLRALQHS